MLEIKNLTKIYKPKKGVAVKALDNISLKFAKTGMVFILGKSGSGKSTLLNVLGGLDSFNSGEFLIKGEKAINFRQSHYDSYRNTYVGFIFQEYNILEEFTVGANIALALELQGKKATNEEINKILEEVDLLDYGNRKPNELSGGQKQRVAIARALIKNPEIIMADEPTGALDSQTGKQVFDTLKKLSLEKLVIVVSHDRDFAENYADRIIELKDGKVISDVSKDSNTNIISERKLAFNENKIIISQGYQLTESDLIQINDYLANRKTSSELMVSDASEKSNLFKDTKEEQIEIDNSGFSLIKSRLSLKNSFKIGSSGLKHKRFRLIMTIFLSFVSFTLFGLADTIASYDAIKTATNSIIDSKIDYASFTKTYFEKNEEFDYYYQNNMKLDEDDIAIIEDNTNLNVTGVYNDDCNLTFENNIAKIDDSDSNDKLTRLYATSFCGFAEVSNEMLNSYGYKLLYGKLPTNLDNEIAISKYMCNMFLEAGYTDEDNEKIVIKSEEDLINKKLTLTLPYPYLEKEFTITGIIDTNFETSRYAKLLEDIDYNSVSDMVVYYQLSNEISSIKKYSLNAACFVANGFISNLQNSAATPFKKINISYCYLNNDLWIDYVSTLDKANKKIYWVDDSKTTLSDSEILLSQEMMDYYIKSLYSEGTVSSSDLAFLDKTIEIDSTNISVLDGVSEVEYYDLSYLIPQYTIKNYLYNLYENDKTKLDNLYDLADINEYSELDNLELLYSLFFQCLISDGLSSEYNQYAAIVEELNELSYSNLFKILKTNESLLSTSIYLNFTDAKDYKIVGVYSYDYENLSFENSIILSDAQCDFYTSEVDDGIYSFVVGSMPDSFKNVKSIVKYNYNKTSLSGENYYLYCLNNSAIDEVEELDEVLEVLGKVFLYVGIFFAIFASLMLSNFIATSISYKKQDIGILRAIGSRGMDVYSIFFAESFIIAMINYTLTLIGTIAFTIIINNVLRQDVGILVTVLGFGIRQIIVILLICVGVAALATLLPVAKIAKKKPIDAIRNK